MTWGIEPISAAGDYLLARMALYTVIEQPRTRGVSKFGNIMFYADIFRHAQCETLQSPVDGFSRRAPKVIHPQACRRNWRACGGLRHGQAQCWSAHERSRCRRYATGPSLDFHER